MKENRAGSGFRKAAGGTRGKGEYGRVSTGGATMEERTPGRGPGRLSSVCAPERSRGLESEVGAGGEGRGVAGDGGLARLCWAFRGEQVAGLS